MTFETTYVGTGYSNGYWRTDEDADAIAAAFVAGNPVMLHIETEDKNLYLKMLAYIPEAINGVGDGTDERFFFATAQISDYIDLDGSFVTDGGKLAISKTFEPL